MCPDVFLIMSQKNHLSTVEKRRLDMIIGMPATTFFSILIWPFVYMAAAIVVYNVMKKQDAQIDDSEFETSVKGRKGADAS